MPSLHSTNIKKRSDKEVTQFFDKYYTTSFSFPTNEVDAVIGFFEKRGFSSDAAIATSTALLTQAKLDNVKVFEIVDTLKGLKDVQISNVVAEILNYDLNRTSSIGYTNLHNQDKLERRNVVV